MNKTKKALQLLLVLALTVLCFAACGTKTHTVTFHTGGDASITQLVADGKSVSDYNLNFGDYYICLFFNKIFISEFILIFS